jgi:hypothetical protein
MRKGNLSKPSVELLKKRISKDYLSLPENNFSNGKRISKEDMMKEDKKKGINLVPEKAVRLFSKNVEVTRINNLVSF